MLTQLPVDAINIDIKQMHVVNLSNADYNQKRCFLLLFSCVQPKWLTGPKTMSLS